MKVGAARKRTLTSLAPVAIPVAVAVALCGVPLLAKPFTVLQCTLYLIQGLLALSLVYVWGKGGIFSFGQGAFYGVGGYTYGVVGINLVDSTSETLVALVVGALVAAAVAALVGYFMFYGKVADVYVAIITLAMTLVLYTVMSSTAGDAYRIGDARLGGFNGLTGVPGITLPGIGELGPDAAWWFTVAIAAAVTVGVLLLERSAFGRVVAAVRVNETRTELLGYDVRGYKLAVFTVGGALAGLAGGLYASWGHFINPSVFALQQAAIVVIWALVGGRVSIAGAFAGAALVEWLSVRVDDIGPFQGQTPLVLGAILILFVLLIPAGIVPTITNVARRLAPATRRRGAAGPGDLGEAVGRLGELPAVLEVGDPLPSDAALLETHAVERTFGGLHAVDGVTLFFPARGLHCLIGPNGAGKSTFFNLLVGRIRPSAGQIVLRGERITRLHPHQRARRGIGIKLQVASLYQELTVAENLWLAAYTSSHSVASAGAAAADLAAWLGLTHRAGEAASALAHGEQQWLEIAMVVAARPAVILLDEPTAGMTHEETARTAGLVAELAARASVVVVEHDMEFVRLLNAPVTVLHRGGVFAQGSLEELTADERVLDIYLGRWAHAGTD